MAAALRSAGVVLSSFEVDVPCAPFIKHLSQISVTKPEPAPEKLSYLNQDRKIINS